MNCFALYLKLACTNHPHIQQLNSCFQTIEGTEIQLDYAKTDAIVVSTLAEAYYVINSHLVASGKLKDILFGFPVSPDRFNDVYHLSQKVEKFCILIGK